MFLGEILAKLETLDWNISKEETAEVVKSRNQETALKIQLLSEDEEMEKKKLLSEGFPFMGKWHVGAVVRATAKYGR